MLLLLLVVLLSSMKKKSCVRAFGLILMAYFASSFEYYRLCTVLCGKNICIVQAWLEWVQLSPLPHPTPWCENPYFTLELETQFNENKPDINHKLFQ